MKIMTIVNTRFNLIRIFYYIIYDILINLTVCMGRDCMWLIIGIKMGMKMRGIGKGDVGWAGIGIMGMGWVIWYGLVCTTNFGLLM